MDGVLQIVPQKVRKILLLQTAIRDVFKTKIRIFKTFRSTEPSSTKQSMYKRVLSTEFFATDTREPKRFPIFSREFIEEIK